MEIWEGALTETIAGLVGIFIGTLAAVAVERSKELRRNRQRARIVLRALRHELDDNHRALQAARPAYLQAPFGKSFYLSTIAWETALASGDLPAIIGVDLADAISAQYALLVRIRYHVDLLTRLWFAPVDIPGYDEIRRGFGQAILEAMARAIAHHAPLAGAMERGGR